MRYLSLVEVLELHEALIAASGGARGVRDLRALESAVSQPRTTFGHADLYPDVVAKGAALCFSLVMNHPFVDGNKRTGHAAMATFLVLNGHEIEATIDEQERVMLEVASGKLTRDSLIAWLRDHVIDRSS